MSIRDLVPHPANPTTPKCIYCSLKGLTWSACVWVNSRCWWRTGGPGVLRFMGSQRVRQDWATELNWTDLLPSLFKFSLLPHHTLLLQNINSSSWVFPSFTVNSLHPIPAVIKKRSLLYGRRKLESFKDRKYFLTLKILIFKMLGPTWSPGDWAVVLIFPQIKLNSQLSSCTSFFLFFQSTQ